MARARRTGTISVVERARLADLAPAWDRLVAAAPLPSPFLRSWWLEETGRGSPLFVLILHDEELIGGVALQADRWLGLPRLAFLGSGPLGPDHLDLVAAPEHAAEVTAALRDWFLGRRPCLLDLRGAARDSHVRRALPGAVREGVESVALYIELPPDPADYMGSRSSRMRNTLRRVRGRLEREGVAYRLAGAADADRALDALRRLHVERWGPDSNFMRGFDRFRAAARRGIASGELTIHELARGDEAIASVAMMEVAGRLSFYQSGRSSDHRWRGAGTVLLARVVEDACRHGSTELDLLRGDEPYKADWANRTRTVMRVRAAVGAQARVARGLLEAVIWTRKRGSRVRRWLNKRRARHPA